MTLWGRGFGAFDRICLECEARAPRRAAWLIRRSLDGVESAEPGRSGWRLRGLVEGDPADPGGADLGPAGHLDR